MYIHIFIHQYIYIDIYTCIHPYILVYMYIFFNIYQYTDIIYAYIYIYTHIFWERTHMCICMYCNVALPWYLTICNGSLYNCILAILLRWDFVGISLEFRWNFVRKHFATRFCLIFFVRILSGFRGLERFPNEIFTKFQRFFCVAKCSGKTFCHKQNFVKT